MRLPFMPTSTVALSSIMLTLGACSSSTTGGGSPVFVGDGNGRDSGTLDVDAGPPPPFTGEAPHTPLPQLVDQQGPVLTTPQLVTITFPNDANTPTLQAFGQTLTSTPWWDVVRAGYCETGSTTSCVGDGPAGTSVAVTTAPAPSYADTTPTQGGTSTLQTFITSLLSSGAIPAPTAQSILAFYIPASTSISFSGGKSCVDFGGYHNSMTYQGTAFAYVIVPECAPQTGSNLTQAQSLTFAASHEIIEAATDPFVTASTSGFYLNFSDPTFLPWNNVGGGEVGDMCLDPFGLNQDQATEGSYTVQRIWSNAQAAAGHDPCVPENAVTPYFNVAPTFNSQIVEMNVGETVTFEADAFSDGAISDWYVDGLDYSGTKTDPNPYVAITVDGAAATRTNNGRKVTVAVTLKKDPSSLTAQFGFPGATAVLRSVNSLSPQTSPPTAGHIWPFLVTTPADALDAGLPPDAN